jgi:hypothetical protein
MARTLILSGFDSIKLNSLAIEISTVLQNRERERLHWRILQQGHQWLLIVGSDGRRLRSLGRRLSMASTAEVQPEHQFRLPPLAPLKQHVQHRLG